MSRAQSRGNIKKRNANLMDIYKADDNYNIHQRPDFPNGAFYAVNKRHNPVSHEETVCKIAAKNGYSMILEAEGRVKVVDKNGRLFTKKSLDGQFMNFSQEIMALNGAPNENKVADAITHSFKKNNVSKVQAKIAISFTPKGSGYHTNTILDGVKEFVRRSKAGETEASPIAYIHIDEASGKMYFHKIKGKI